MAAFEIDEVEVSGGLPPVRWGWLVGIGAVVAVVGVVLLLNPFSAARTLALLVALALLFEAIEMLLDAKYLAKPVWGYLLGAIYLGIGILAVVWPGITLWSLAIVVGVGFIVSGITMLLIRRDVAKFGVGGLPIWIGILSIVTGVMALVWPGATILVLAIILGVRVLFTGIALIAAGFAIRKAG